MNMIPTSRGFTTGKTTRARFTGGFTLLEMIVSVGLFAVVVTIAIPTLVVVMNAGGRAQAVQATVDNVSFAIDAMSSTVRLGSSYYCTSDSLPLSSSLPTGAQDCSTGATAVVFTTAQGVRTAYRYNTASTSLQIRTDSTDWITLTSDRVRIDDGQFIVTGSAPFDGAQPSVRLLVRGSSRDEATAPTFYLQTSMEQYVGDKGLIFRKIANNTNGGPVLANDDAFGGAMSAVGDINADGVGDIVVGANGDSSVCSFCGAVHVLFMNKNGTVASSKKIASQTNGGPNLAAFDYLGSAVSGVGDLDSNGTSDIAVGAFGDDSGGAVYILFMRPDGTASSTVRIASGVNGGPTLSSVSAFGSSIVSLGDLNNDGTADLAVGAPNDSTGGFGRGAVYILFMRADGTVASFVKLASGSSNVPTINNGDAFGSSVAAVGDLNSDGVPDLVVGSPNNDTGGSDRGAAYVLFMNANGTVGSSVQIASDTNGGPTLVNASYFAGSAAGVGDLDRNGVPDLAVGFNENLSGSLNGMGVYLLFMNTNGTVSSYTRVGHQLNGGPTLVDGDYFGASVGSVGDLNRDGILDLGAGLWGDDTGGSNRGAVYIMFGK